MKKIKPAPTRILGKALTSGIVLGAGLGAHLRADAQTEGRDWFREQMDFLRRQGKAVDLAKRHAPNASREMDALHGTDGNDLLDPLTPGCVITGTPDAETIIFGGSECDTAFGLAGDDIMYSYTGTTIDTLWADGGPGADYLYTIGRGVAIMYGGTGDDEMEINARKNVIVHAGENNDLIRGYAYNENVFLDGSTGDDFLGGYSYYGSVLVEGKEDDDEIHAITRGDTVFTNGGLGNDHIWSGSKTKQQCSLGGEGDDHIHAATLTGPRNLLFGGSGADVLEVGILNPYSLRPDYEYQGSYLDGGTDEDILLAHSGNDTLISGGGADILMAYTGDDLLIATDGLITKANGGPGVDQLQIDFSLDLSAASPSLLMLERLDIGGTGSNTLTVHSSSQVKDMTESFNTLAGRASCLIVEGGPDDMIVLSSSWVLADTQTIGGVDYNVYAAPDSSHLLVHPNLTVSVGVDDAAGIEASLEVYPNPSSGRVHLSFEASHSGVLHISLTDLAGRMVWTEDRWILQGNYQGDMDLDKIPSGIYLLQLTLGTFSTHVKLAVQQYLAQD